MKKYILTFAFLLTSSVFAVDTTPQVEVRLSPGIKPTQRVHPGDKSVELHRLWFEARGHESEGIEIKKLLFTYEGDDRDHFLRYSLMQENKLLGKLSLVDADYLEFSNLSIWLEDGNIIELRLLGDIATGDIAGDHQFSIAHPAHITLEKNDIRDLETHIVGDFPIRANKVLIDESFETPPEDCNLREEPVCGKDGKTYYNLCIPFQKGVEILHKGTCQHWSFPEPEPCTEEYNPVCGDDGETYANACFLSREEGVYKEHDGECFPKNFERPRTFLRAVELYDLKNNELKKLRPRLSDRATSRLDDISFVLHQYNFTFDPRQDMVKELGDFLEFTQNLSDRTRLEQEIELLNAAVIKARTDSAHEKYQRGKIPFIDVDEEAWFFGPVKFLAERDWTTGYINENGEQTGLFRPGNLVTKAEITKLVFDAAEIDYHTDIPLPLNPYAPDHWATDVIAKAEEMDLSIWEDLPNPEKKVDRVEVLELIFEVFGEDLPTRFPDSSFSDVSENSPYLEIIEHAKNIGIIIGYPDGTFRPEESISRAEAAKVIKKTVEILR
ncbi:S-layer homology domain-containing protein [Candidatus Gracilibacteria bacterium]|nr:S-layer homology domain-containing protein [Candidatus Gracilibacteria bacterium]MCF7819157.1 S-layer homology domain-containing protein [Candidatus Gracilibacteria bacterium]